MFYWEIGFPRKLINSPQNTPTSNAPPYPARPPVGKLGRPIPSLSRMGANGGPVPAASRPLRDWNRASVSAAPSAWGRGERAARRRKGATQTGLSPPACRAVN